MSSGHPYVMGYWKDAWVGKHNASPCFLTQFAKIFDISLLYWQDNGVAGPVQMLLCP